MHALFAICLSVVVVVSPFFYFFYFVLRMELLCRVECNKFHIKNNIFNGWHTQHSVSVRGETHMIHNNHDHYTAAH